MSEVAQQETEYVNGVIAGIIQKAPDKWQVSVTPDGSQYPKNLWTKDAELVTALSQKIGAQGAFVCGVSNWTNNEGKPVRSLWINSLSDGQNAIPSGASQTPAPAPQNARPASDGMTPEKWDAKERRDFMSRAWAQTIAGFTHTIKTDEKPEDAFLRLQPFQRKVYQDICGHFAYPEDDSDVPFD